MNNYFAKNWRDLIRPKSLVVDRESLSATYGQFDDLVASQAGTSAFYVAVWIADLTAGGEDEGAPTLGVIGRAYGPSGSRRSVAVSLTRDAVAAVKVGAWAEIR